MFSARWLILISLVFCNYRKIVEFTFFKILSYKNNVFCNYRKNCSFDFFVKPILQKYFYIKLSVITEKNLQIGWALNFFVICLEWLLTHLFDIQKKQNIKFRTSWRISCFQRLSRSTACWIWRSLTGAGPAFADDDDITLYKKK